MALKFDFASVYDYTNWIVTYNSAQGYQERFLRKAEQVIANTEFPGIDLEIAEFRSGGWLAQKEVTPMLSVSFRKSQFKALGIYFRAQTFGNVVLFSLLNTVDKGFWNALQGKPTEEIVAGIRSKCQNWAQFEEFTALTELGALTFRLAMEELDPAWEQNKSLLHLKR